MRCISPIRLQTGQFVPCGKCNCCLANRRADWSFRIRQELKVSASAVFITLTYDDYNQPVTKDGLGELSKYDLRCFFKRLRKFQAKTNVDSAFPNIRYYAVGEYGTRTLRPHYHAIVFNLKAETILKLESIWKLGNVHVGVANGATIHYTTKYVINADGDYGERQPPFTAISNRSGGIGKNYLSTIGKKDYVPAYAFQDGNKLRMPRYYADKIWEKGQRLLMQLKASKQIEIKEMEEIVRLSEYDPDPVGYLIEAERFAHDQIKTKANKLNKF